METLSQAKVLVTGASGFIGSYLTRRLVKEGAEVYAWIRPASRLVRIEEILPSLRVYDVDIRDFAQVQKALREIKPRKIYHLAAHVNVERTFQTLEDTLETNLKGTLNLLRVLELEKIDYDCFVNTGTCEEYGDNPAPFREDQPVNPVSPYSASKAAATSYCQMLHKTLGCPIVTLRPFLTYGPSQGPARMIPQAILSVLEKKEFKMTPGEQTREFIYVEDVVEGYLKASITPGAIGEVINIGNGREYPIKEVVLKIFDLMGAEAQPRIGALPYRQGENWHFYSDPTKAWNILRWKAQISLEEGLRRTIDWYKTHYVKNRNNLWAWMSNFD